METNKQEDKKELENQEARFQEEGNKEGEEGTKVVAAPTAEEELALTEGWVPKQDWVKQGKNPDEWRPAKEFNERGELFGEIKNLKNDLKKQNQVFKALLEHHKNVAEAAKREAIAELQAQRRAALKDNDVETAMAIDDRLDKVREAPLVVPNIQAPAVEVEPEPSAYFKQWSKVNRWYQLKGDDEASRHADVIGQMFKQKHPDATDRELLEHVEEKVAKRYPELFENKARKEPADVNSGGERRSSGEDNFKLTENEERVCKQLVEQGVMTRKKYIEEIKKVRSM
jgi:hypothetical protein